MPIRSCSILHASENCGMWPNKKLHHLTARHARFDRRGALTRRAPIFASRAARRLLSLVLFVPSWHTWRTRPKTAFLMALFVALIKSLDVSLVGHQTGQLGRLSGDPISKYECFDLPFHECPDAPNHTTASPERFRAFSPRFHAPKWLPWASKTTPRPSQQKLHTRWRHAL